MLKMQVIQQRLLCAYIRDYLVISLHDSPQIRHISRAGHVKFVQHISGWVFGTWS